MQTLMPQFILKSTYILNATIFKLQLYAIFHNNCEKKKDLEKAALKVVFQESYDFP